MLLEPVILFAHKPTSRLDVITQRETVDWLVELAQERGSAVLIVSHDKALLQKTCEKVIDIVQS